MSQPGKARTVFERMTPLALDLKPGEGKLDRFFSHLPLEKQLRFKRPQTVSEFRNEVNLIANAAVMLADEVPRYSDHYDNASVFMDGLKSLSKSARSTASSPWVTEMSTPVLADGECDVRNVDAEIGEIKALAAQLAAKIYDFSQRRKIQPKFNFRKAVPLQSIFYSHFAEAWGRWTGEPASRSKSGPFVHFLSEAWEALNLPNPDRASTYFANKADKGPADHEEGSPIY